MTVKWPRGTVAFDERREEWEVRDGPASTYEVEFRINPGTDVLESRYYHPWRSQSESWDPHPAPAEGGRDAAAQDLLDALARLDPPRRPHWAESVGRLDAIEHVLRSFGGGAA